ncbi:MAG: alpha/beta hydrolase-fold protein [Paraglaciecola sp.]|uniref:alpha/beta hydrolase-fold protein n=1 Tax=Paraglaciecola sp. TaxID=1920173 RepID=UPI003296FA04
MFKQFRQLTFVTIMLVMIHASGVKAGIRGSTTVDALQSKILNEQRDLLIHLPNNYHQHTTRQYPVLYLLDGQRNLRHTAGTLDLLNQDNKAQEMIIVAINNTHRTRDFTPTYDQSYNQWGISGGADNFLDFIEKELIPYVAKNYRTNNFKILAGHSLGGLLAVYALQSRPQLFQAHFAFSPSLWWHDQVIFKQAEDFFSNIPELHNYLYTNMGNEDGDMLSSYERYTALLKAHAPKGFRYNADLDTSETHGSTALAGQALAYRGLYASLQAPQDVIDQGMAAIKQFYKTQSAVYGYEIKPSYRAVNSLGYKALQQKDFTSAIAIFKDNVKRFPNKADAYDSLADGFEANGQLDKALEMRDLVIQKSISENVENNAYKTRRANLIKLIQEQK